MYKVYQYYHSGYKVLRGLFSHKDYAEKFLSDMKEKESDASFGLITSKT